MIELTLTPHQQHLRETLLEHADWHRAKEVSNDLMIMACKAFNSADTDVATSILARALLSHAMMQIAGAWWTDVTKLPLPDTYQAAMSIVVDLPPGFVTTNFTMEQE